MDWQGFLFEPRVRLSGRGVLCTVGCRLPGNPPCSVVEQKFTNECEAVAHIGGCRLQWCVLAAMSSIRISSLMRSCGMENRFARAVIISAAVSIEGAISSPQAVFSGSVIEPLCNLTCTT